MPVHLEAPSKSRFPAIPIPVQIRKHRISATTFGRLTGVPCLSMGDSTRLLFGRLVVVGCTGLVLTSCASTTEGTEASEPNQIEASAEPTPTDANADLYESPDSIQQFIDDAKPSTVMLVCGRSYGSGWVINTASPPSIRTDREFTFDPDASSFVVTVEHVIDGCAKDSEKKFKAFIGGEEAEVEILNWHRKDDIALLVINRKEPGLTVGRRPPQGAWAVSIGYPLDYEYPVPIVGNVIDAEGPQIVTQMFIQPGSSGSPLLNSQGEVIGTMKEMYMDTEGETATGWSVANTTAVLCERIFDCVKTPITTTN